MFLGDGRLFDVSMSKTSILSFFLTFPKGSIIPVIPLLETLNTVTPYSIALATAWEKCWYIPSVLEHQMSFVILIIRFVSC